MLRYPNSFDHAMTDVWAWTVEVKGVGEGISECTRPSITSPYVATGGPTNGPVFTVNTTCLY